MGDLLNWQIMQSVIRQIAQWIGGALAAKGLLTDDQNTLFVGAFVAVAALVFSVVSARFKAAAIGVAGGKENVKAIVEANKSGA